MSKPSEPSIPTSPPPGKDPPPSSITSFPPISPSLPQPSSKSTAHEKLPAITTQPPSRSTTFHPNLTPLALHPSSSTSTFLPPHSQTTSQIPQVAEVKEVARPASFAPFFTLITDVKDTEAETHTYHPSYVHYIFSDDDTDTLNSALLSTLSKTTQTSPLHSEELPASATKGSSSSSSSTSQSKKGKAGNEEREERIIIVDINTTPQGNLGIKKLSSMNQEWQVLNASIDNAPTWDGPRDLSEEGEEGGGMGGLMLRIEGTGIPSSDMSSSSGFRSRSKEKDKEGLAESENTFPEQEMQALLESFDRKMLVLRGVVGQGSEVEGDASENVRGEEADVRRGSGAAVVGDIL